MKVFLQAIYGQIFLNLYIGWHGYKALPPKKTWRMPLVFLFILEWLLYFTGFFFYKDLPDNVLIPILKICNTWYIASIYLTLGLIMLDLIRLINRYFPCYPTFIRNNWQKVKLILFFLFVLGVTGLMFYGYHQANHPIVKNLQIHIPKAAGARNEMRIVLFSDTHFGEMIGKKLADRYVSLTNAQHPDMVIIAGDIMDYESRFAIYDQIEEELRMLQAPLGVYITLGNHEYRANRHAKIRWLNQTGAVLLVDSVVMPDSTFYLIGRDDAINKSRSTLQSLMKGLDKTKPLILVDHQPSSSYEVVMNNIDLSLHGHTHGGQFWPYSLILDRFIYKCFHGHYSIGSSQFVVSSGIGFAGAPYRIGTRAEMIVLDITFDKSSE